MSRSCFYTLELTYYLDRKWALPALFQFFTSLHIFNSYSCFKNCSAQLQLPAVATQCILASVIRDWCCTNSLWNLQFQCTDVILGNKVYCLTVKYPATTLNVWISQFIWLPIKKTVHGIGPKNWEHGPVSQCSPAFRNMMPNASSLQYKWSPTLLLSGFLNSSLIEWLYAEAQSMGTCLGTRGWLVQVQHVLQYCYIVASPFNIALKS